MLDSLRLNVEQYNYGDGDDGPDWDSLCTRLTRDWARSICSQWSAPLRQAWPGDLVSLGDRRDLTPFDSWLTVGRERVGDQVRAMTLEPGMPDVVCDRERGFNDARFCTAAVLIEEDLIAIWGVGDWGEPAEVKAARQARLLEAVPPWVRETLDCD